MYRKDMIKLEGYIRELEVHKGVLNALGGKGDSLIASSAILGTITGNVTLGTQSVFLASQSRLHIETLVMKINGKICVGQFHRVLLQQNEYVVCAANKIEENVYELLSVLSPSTGILHMQIGMGASITNFKKSTNKGGLVWFTLTFVIAFTFIIVLPQNFDLVNFLIFFSAIFTFYFLFMYIIKSSAASLIYLSENSEQIFDLYGFKNPQEIYLFTARHEDTSEKLILESIYDYRKVIKDDPYPEDYSDKK